MEKSEQNPGEYKLVVPHNIRHFVDNIHGHAMMIYGICFPLVGEVAGKYIPGKGVGMIWKEKSGRCIPGATMENTG